MAKALHIFSTFERGRAQLRLAAIARAAPDLTHHVVSLTNDFSGLVEMPDGTTSEVYSARRGVYTELPNPLGLRHRIVALAPDLLCTYNAAGLEAALVNAAGPKLPHIHFEDDAEAGANLQNGRRLRSAALAGSVIVVSSPELERSARKLWRVPKGQLRRIPFGVDLSRFAPDVGRDEARLSVTVGAVGDLSLAGNLPRLIRSFSTMRARVAARLAVFGDGPARPELESLARAGGARSRIFFLRRPQKIEAALRDIDIYADPGGAQASDQWLQEAAAAGLPALAPASAGARAVLSAQNGRLLPPPGDDEAYGVALTRLVNDLSLRRRLGSANADRARTEFALEKVVGEHLALVRPLLAGGR